MEEEIKRLKLENAALLKEVVHLQGLTTSGKNKWIKGFIIVGAVMFIASTFESIYTMFDLGREVIDMSRFKVIFAVIGFVFVAANDSLGSLANSAGKSILEKFK